MILEIADKSGKVLVTIVISDELGVRVQTGSGRATASQERPGQAAPEAAPKQQAREERQGAEPAKAQTQSARDEVVSLLLGAGKAEPQGGQEPQQQQPQQSAQPQPQAQPQAPAKQGGAIDVLKDVIGAEEGNALAGRARRSSDEGAKELLRKILDIGTGAE